MTEPIKQPTYEKDRNQVKRTTTVEQVVRYDLKWLYLQREQIQKSRDAELAEVDKLIAEAEKLGLTVKEEMIVPIKP